MQQDKQLKYFDWEGTPTEPPDSDSNVKVWAWRVEPCLHDVSFDNMTLRSWQEFSTYLETYIAQPCDTLSQSELANGFTVKIQLVQVHQCDLDDSGCTNWEKAQ